MKCLKCGAENEDIALFCKSCGDKLTPESPTEITNVFDHVKDGEIFIRDRFKVIKRLGKGGMGEVLRFKGTVKNWINTDAIDDPKRFLIKLVNSSSKNNLKHDIVPAKNSTASIGKNYNEPLVCFVYSEWDLYKAAEHSESLKRMIGRLHSFIPYLNSWKI